MSDYTKTTDFTAKDALITGDPGKLVKGSELDTEYGNISTALATKADKLTSYTNEHLLVSSGDGLGDSNIPKVSLWVPKTAFYVLGATTLENNTWHWGEFIEQWDDIGIDVASDDTKLGINNDTNYWWQIVCQVKLDPDNTSRYLIIRLENEHTNMMTAQGGIRYQEQAHNNYSTGDDMIVTMTSPVFRNSGGDSDWRLRFKQRNDDGLDRDIKTGTEESWVHVTRWSTW